ncbi:Hypothetical predicted protein, partial [Mytilus galloprovincialis]
MCSTNIAGYTCACDPGYEGTNCDTLLNRCSKQPCVHGRCVNGATQFSCVCNTGYEGPTCSQ